MQTILRNSLVVDLSLAASRFLPRGRGAIPRLLGRWVLQDQLYEDRAPSGFLIHWTGNSLDMLAHLKSGGEWDQHVLTALDSLITPNSVFYDIGSNIGFMALSVASKHPSVTTYAFEPLPDMAGAIASSALANTLSNLTVENVAVSNNTGETSFFLPRHSIHASLVAREADATELRVKTVRLDDLTLPPPDVIKIDVEGAEIMVIEGGKRLLAEHVPHIVYECDGNTDRFSHTPADMIRALADLGYDLFYRIYGDARHQIYMGQADVPFGDFVALSSRRLTKW